VLGSPVFAAALEAAWAGTNGLRPSCAKQQLAAKQQSISKGRKRNRIPRLGRGAYTSPMTIFSSIELTPLMASVGVIAGAFLLNRSVASVLRRQNAERPSVVLLSKLVTARNLIAVGTGAVLLSLWVKELASFVLSLAAIAGALLLVSKEFILCWLGSFMRTISRPFQIGDIVEIGAWRGKVVDADLLTTTLLEMGRAQQFTGNRVEIPNSTFLSTPVKNLSVTGEYFLNNLPIPFPVGTDIEATRQMLLDAATPIVSEFQKNAAEHFKRIEDAHVIDLPSTEIRAFIEPVDGRTINLVLRFACPAAQRVSVEQRILQSLYKAIGGTKVASKDD
jgi:small-conductance mechanosensitive channel